MRLPAQLSSRKSDSHKGDYGHVFIVAGSRRFAGAAALCSLAALRSGAGLVTLGCPEGVCVSLSGIRPFEKMVLPLPQTRQGALSMRASARIEEFAERCSCVALGPGLSRSAETVSLVRRLVRSIRKTLVIDADALNALSLCGGAKLLRLRECHDTILTPHPGEMGRLIGRSVAYVQARRKAVALNFAKDYNCIVVLKGAQTCITSSRGEVYINKSGNPGMSTAGSGDVLTGMIAAFAGQGIRAFEAAVHAVYLHGLAGDIASREKTQAGMIASDIIDSLALAFKKAGVK